MIGRLTLDQLRVLVAIDETGSFSAAGRSLGRAQSVMSQTVATLEAAQGVSLFDRGGYRPRPTEAGRVLMAQARVVLRAAARFEAVAAGMRAGVEAELALAIDPLMPSAPLIGALHGLRRTFPDLPVAFSTERLGGALARLRSGDAALALCPLLPEVPDDVVAHPILTTKMRAVAAPGHPLASLTRPLAHDDLAPHVQLVLSEDDGRGGRDYGIVSARHWRFVDLARRLDFLRAGFGWCRMPSHLVDPLLTDGSLVALDIERDDPRAHSLTLYAAHRVDRGLGPGGRWLLQTLQENARSSDEGE